MEGLLHLSQKLLNSEIYIRTEENWNTLLISGKDCKAACSTNINLGGKAREENTEQCSRVKLNII
jgi:hypothetical protein